MLNRSTALRLLCAALAASILGAACQSSTPAPGSSAAPSSSAPASSSAAPASSEPASSEAGVKPLFDTKQELTVMREENASQVIRGDSLTNKWLEETHNLKITIEAVPAASYQDKKNVLISTNNMPDIMKVSMGEVRQYAREDMFVNISDNRDKVPNFFTLYDADPNLSMLTVDNKVYSFPVLRHPSQYDSAAGQFPVIRMDLLKKYNLETPKTFDELYDVLKVLKEKDPNAIPLVNRKGGSTSGTEKLLDTMAFPLGSGFNSGSAAVYWDPDVDGGRYVFGPAHENFKAVLSYLGKLYKDGLLDPDYATNTVDLWKEKMSSGKGLMYFDNSGFRIDFEAALRTIDPDARYEVIPTLTNSLGHTRNTMYDFNWPDQHYVISDSSKKADIALTFFNWAYSEEGAIAKGYGIEGETYEIVDGKPQMLPAVMDEIIKSGTNSPKYELMSRFGLGLLDFTPYVDIGSDEGVARYQQSPEDLERLLATVEMCNNDKGLQIAPYAPALTAEQQERFKELRTNVNNYILQELDKFITGQAPIDSYDAVIAQARTLGATEMEEIYNAADASYK